MADNLPPPLITEILSRLPAKSLLHCRCVSKQWKSTIDDPHFIKLHLKHSLKTITNHTLILLKGCEFYSLDFPTLNQAIKIDHPFQNENRSLAVVGSCNGLLCLIKENLELEPVIFNPTTKQTREVPFSQKEFPSKEMPLEELLGFGFGYDQVNDDYKLVRIVQFCLKSANKVYSEVKVYSLKMNSWTIIKGLCDDYVFMKERNRGVFVNGCLHWMMAKNAHKAEFITMLVAFNLESSEWKSVAQPEYSPGHFGSCWMNVGVLGDCLSVVCCYPMERSESWVMKEYGVKESWTKICILPETMTGASLDILVPIAYSKDCSKVLFGQEGFSKLFWFDLCRQTIESVKIPHIASKFTCIAEILVESLVSLGSHETTKRKRKSDKLDGFLSKGFKLKL